MPCALSAHNENSVSSQEDDDEVSCFWPNWNVCLPGNYSLAVLTQKEPEGIFMNMSVSAVVRVHLRNFYIPVG